MTLADGGTRIKKKVKKKKERTKRDCMQMIPMSCYLEEI